MNQGSLIENVPTKVENAFSCRFFTSQLKKDTDTESGLTDWEGPSIKGGPTQ